MKKTTIILAGLLMLVATAAMAEVPKTINYQARLTDLAGNPIADGAPSVTFRLYESATAAIAEAKWTDTFTVYTKNGFFNVLLGSGSVPFPGALDFSKQYWVGIKVGSDDEMTERLPLSSVPYAMRAEYANQIAQSILDAFLPVGSIVAWTNHITGTPTLSGCFLPCNGQQITDSASPLHNQYLPNLNGYSTGLNSPGFSSKERLFLRGSITSGTGEVDSIVSHSHSQNVTMNSGGTGTRRDWVEDGTGYQTYPQGVNTGSFGGSETRPKSMSVIWVMRIK